MILITYFIYIEFDFNFIYTLVKFSVNIVFILKMAPFI